MSNNRKHVSSQPSSLIDVLIVGGGPAGLAAAAQAVRDGYSVRVVERGTRFGGMSASLTVGGQRVDLGSHRLHPSASDQTQELLKRLLGDDLQTRDRNGRIRLLGKWLGFPLQPLNLVRSTPLSFGARAFLDVLTNPFRKERADTYSEVVRAGLGGAVLRDFYGPYAEKLWGRPASQLSGEVARRRISVRGPVQLVSKLLSNSSQRPVFLYPRLGYGQIVDELVRELETSERAQSSLQTSVTELRPQADRVDVTLSVGARSDGAESNVEELSARRVFWTASPRDLARVRGGTGFSQVEHRAMVLVYLVLDTNQYTPFDAHYFPGLDTKSARISEPKNYRDGPDPSGTTVLCAELACDVGDSTWTATPKQLQDWVVDDLVSNELPIPEVIDTHVEQLRSVYPVYGVADDMEQSTDFGDLGNLERVHVFGRQGLVVADNLHHVLEMALGAVSCLGSDDVWDGSSWDVLQRSFATNVVED